MVLLISPLNSLTMAFKKTKKSVKGHPDGMRVEGNLFLFIPRQHWPSAGPASHCVPWIVALARTPAPGCRCAPRDGASVQWPARGWGGLTSGRLSTIGQTRRGWTSWNSLETWKWVWGGAVMGRIGAWPFQLGVVGPEAAHWGSGRARASAGVDTQSALGPLTQDPSGRGALQGLTR